MTMRFVIMGLAKNNEQEKRDAKKTRGSTNNTARLAAFGPGNNQASADWQNCDPKRLQAVVVGITGLGGAVTFGLSRDMGAHSLTLLLDDSRKTLWFNGGADLDEALDEVAATLADLAIRS